MKEAYVPAMSEQPAPESEPQADDDAPGCTVALLLFIACMVGPWVAASRGGPWAGLIAALLAIVAWSYLGLRPMPGLIPGLLALMVWLQSGWVLVLSGIRIARALL
jgi:hypothetical protein